MATIEVTIQNFREITRRDGIAILDFWASWCTVCAAFAPVYEAVSEEYPDIAFGTIDTEAAVELADALGIRALPTLAVYRDSVRVFLQAGALPKPVLEDLIADVRALDMDEVRAELEDHSHLHGHARS